MARCRFPFVDDVEAAGSTPTDLAARIQARLKDFIVNPVVTVVLEESRPLLVSVLGEVAKPGSYQLDAGSGVLQALAMAAGMTPFADRDRIMVIRQVPAAPAPSGSDSPTPPSPSWKGAPPRSACRPGTWSSSSSLAPRAGRRAAHARGEPGSRDGTRSRRTSLRCRPSAAIPAHASPSPSRAGIPFQEYATTPPVSARGILVDLGCRIHGSDPHAFRERIRDRLGHGHRGDAGREPHARPFQLPPRSRLRRPPHVPAGVRWPGARRPQLGLRPGKLAALPALDLGVDGTTIFGENSQLVPASTPGSWGPPPPVLNPVRTFSTYPYVALIGSLRA